MPLSPASCTPFLIPPFNLELPPSETRVPDGLTSVSRSNRELGTMELAASCGLFRMYASATSKEVVSETDYPGSYSCGELGQFNDALAGIGVCPVPLPPRATEAFVNVVCDVIVDQGPYSLFPSLILYVQPGGRDVGFDGGVIVWTDLVLSVGTSDGGTSRASKLVGDWATAAGVTSIDAPSGPLVRLSVSLRVPANVPAIEIWLDAHSVAFSEGAGDNPGRGYAGIDFREQKNFFDIGAYMPPTHLAIDNISAQLCPLLLTPIGGSPSE
jgi:hypothetical protein